MMRQNDIEFEADEAEIAARPRKVRWALRGMLVLCGVLLVMVMASYPRVAAKVQTGVDRLSGLFAGQRDVALLSGAPRAGAADRTADPDTDPASRPPVSAMPTSRVPVRRGGVSATD